MLGRRRKPPVLAEIPATQGASSRLGALGRARLAAFSRLASDLGGSGAVLVTGPDKSDVALGLAAAASAEGRRVALLECDLSAPKLAGLLGLSATPGFHEYIRGEADAGQILQPLVLAGPASGRATEPLVCIAAGEPDPAPAALLASEHCRHAIEKLRRAYELLIIDGPPLEQEASSLRALAGLVDATIACGERAEIPKRLAVRVSGLVLLG